jgi:hypothetical protein
MDDRTDIEQVLTIPRSAYRPMACDPEGATQRWDHGKPGLVLTQDDEIPGDGFFSTCRGPRAPSLAWLARLAETDT